MSKVNKGRRNFIKSSGRLGTLALSGPSLNLLIQGLVNGIVQDANANALNSQIKNYVHLQFPGGPPRWMYDLLLTPWEGDSNKRITNGSVATHLAGSGTKTNTGYALTSANTQNGKIYLPYLWRYSVPTSTGDVPMKKLLQDMMLIRGIDMEINSHGLNRTRQHQPVPGEPSIGGHIADHTKKLIPGVQFGNNEPFVSINKHSSIQAKFGNNALGMTLQDFNNHRKGSIAKLHSNYKSAMETAIASLNQSSNIDPRTAEIVAKNRVNAELILRRGLANIDSFWSETYPKYKNIIQKVIQQRKSNAIKNINDTPIQISNANKKWGEINRVQTSHSDYRNILSNDSYIPQMAESFTIIEYLLKEGLTAYVNASMLPFKNLKRNSGGTFDATHDLHSGGKMVVTYLMCNYYRAFSGCLLELIQALKSAPSKDASGSVFDNTLINVTAEFNRSAADNGFGSDHGVNAHSVALYSGMIKGPYVIGNIKKGPSSGRYKGTWGESALTDLKNGGKVGIRIGHVGETIVRLLGLPPISVNAFPLIDTNGNPITKKAKIV